MANSCNTKVPLPLEAMAQLSTVSLGEKVQHDLPTFHQSEQPTQLIGSVPAKP
jgi:hypothetical protein